MKAIRTGKLTLQELELLDTASAYNGAQHKAICGKAVLELIEYKKIEDDLSIGLDVLYELLVRGCYYIFEGEILYCFEPQHIDVSNKYFITPYNTKHYFSEYGVTWALTRGELE